LRDCAQLPILGYHVSASKASLLQVFRQGKLCERCTVSHVLSASPDWRLETEQRVERRNRAVR
jgi:hypothetical protein